MEYFCSGWPDLWAIVRGEPYIVGECGWNTEVETTQSFGGIPVVHAQTISGFAKLFGKERFEVYDEQGVPDPIEMKIVGNGELVTFEQTMFSSFERLPYYDNVAVEVEWVAKCIEKEQSQELNSLGA